MQLKWLQLLRGTMTSQGEVTTEALSHVFTLTRDSNMRMKQKTYLSSLTSKNIALLIAMLKWQLFIWENWFLLFPCRHNIAQILCVIFSEKEVKLVTHAFVALLLFQNEHFKPNMCMDGWIVQCKCCLTCDSLSVVFIDYHSQQRFHYGRLML